MMTIVGRIKLLLASLLLAATGCAAAADVRVLVVRDDSPVARQAADQLSRDFMRFGWSASEVVIGAERSPANSHREGEQIIVGLGARGLAAAAKLAGTRPLVGALASRAAVEEVGPLSGDRWSVIVLDQPAERWANLLQLAFPGRTQVGVLVGPTAQKSMRNLERRLPDHRQTLVSEPLSGADELVPALERLLPRINVLLALPDPTVHNRNTVQPLLLTTYRAGVPVVGYSESYLQAGCTVALYSTVPQISAQVVESMQQLLEGRAGSGIQAPRYFTVGVNNAVARSLSLSLPPAGELQDRLRAADQ